MKRQFSSTVIGATFLISATGLVSKGVGFIREVLYANYFGLRSQFDIYLVSAALPMIISSMLLYLGQNYFIPSFNRIDQSENLKRKQFFVKSFWSYLTFGILLFIVLLSVSSPLINFLLDGSNKHFELALLIFRLFIITLPLTAIVSIISAYQQANFHYKAPAYAQLIVNITLVVILFLFNKNFGIVIIPIASLAGTVLQTIYLFSKIDVSLSDLFNHLKIDVKRFSIPGPFLTIIIIEFIGQLYIISDRYFVNQVDTGGISALNYSINLILLPISIFSIAISTAIFPKLSENFATHSSDSLQTNFNLSLKFNLAIFVPITFILFFYGDEIIRILFERGNFNQANSIMTFKLTKILALSLIFYSSYNVANKLIYSISQIKKLLWLTLFGLLLKVVLNFILVKELKQSGLAISTVISYMFFFIGAIYIIERAVKIKSKSTFIKESILLIMNGALAFFLTKFLIERFIFLPILSALIGVTFFLMLFYFNIIYIRHSIIQILKSLIQQFIVK